MRHSFLHIKVIYRITELQSKGHGSELEILVQKIKVKKLYFKSCLLNTSYQILFILQGREKKKHSLVI